MIFCYWCVARPRFFYWRTDVGQVDLADILNTFVKNSENFLETFEKKVSTKKMRFCQNILTTFWVSFLSHFLSWKFFQSPLETFLCNLRMCSMYLQGLPDLDICVSKKIVTPRHTNQIICQEKWKQLRFWKDEPQNVVKTFWQNLIFSVETFFFQRSLELF